MVPIVKLPNNEEFLSAFKAAVDAVMRTEGPDFIPTLSDVKKLVADAIIMALRDEVRQLKSQLQAANNKLATLQLPSQR